MLRFINKIAINPTWGEEKLGSKKLTCTFKITLLNWNLITLHLRANITYHALRFLLNNEFASWKGSKLILFKQANTLSNSCIV
jgi:hypothetical protein